MNIVVLAGGVSTERDVSIVTGTMVLNALIRNGHKAILADVFMGRQLENGSVEEEFANAHSIEAPKVSSISPDTKALKKSRGKSEDGFFGPNVLKLCKSCDIVFMALHGEDGENGKIQAAFDLMGIRYTGTGYLGSALAMNKDMAKILFNRNNIPTPKGCTLIRGNEGSYTPNFPCVVKPACGGSSVGVSIVNNEEEFKSALSEAYRWEEKLVVEEYIKGREFSIGVVGGDAYPIIEIAPIEGFYDYKNKYQSGSTVETCPAVLSESETRQMQHYAVEAANALKLDTYARMDFIMKENGEIYCLEANTLPGMTPTSLLPQEAGALGISFEELCEKIINISLKKYEN